MKKRIFSTLMAGALCAGTFLGCGQKETAESQETETETIQETETETIQGTIQETEEQSESEQAPDIEDDVVLSDGVQTQPVDMEVLYLNMIETSFTKEFNANTDYVWSVVYNMVSDNEAKFMEMTVANGKVMASKESVEKVVKCAFADNTTMPETRYYNADKQRYEFELSDGGISSVNVLETKKISDTETTVTVEYVADGESAGKYEFTLRKNSIEKPIFEYAVVSFKEL